MNCDIRWVGMLRDLVSTLQLFSLNCSGVTIAATLGKINTPAW